MECELLGPFCTGPACRGWEHCLASMPPWMPGPLLMEIASSMAVGHRLGLASSFLFCEGQHHRDAQQRHPCSFTWVTGFLAMGPLGGRIEGSCLRLIYSIKQWLRETGLEHQPGPKQRLASAAVQTYRRASRASAKTQPARASAIDTPSARQQRVIDAAATSPVVSMDRGPLLAASGSQGSGALCSRTRAAPCCYT